MSSPPPGHDPLPDAAAVAVLSPPAPAVAADPQEAVAARALRLALRTCLGVLGDRAHAEDVAQEVALVALARHGELRDAAAFDAWVHRVAVRAAVREAGRAARRRDAERRAATPDRTGDDLDAGGAAALLAGLPPRQRAALVLRHVHDLDDAAIARALGCRRGTVRSLLTRGRAAVRAAHADTPTSR